VPLPAFAPAPGQPDTGAEFARGRILVAFQDGTSPNEKRDILIRASSALQLPPHSENPYFDIVQVAGEGITAGEAIARLRSDPRVRVAEPDYIVHTQERIPNDPDFVYLWGLRNTGQGSYSPTTCTACSKPGADISATRAWDITTGSSQVVVAVIDTGVDYNHPDLTANILRDDSGKVVGHDYANKDDDPMDDFGHGTHCAGTIGAVGDNGTGVAGVCWKVKIMPLKFLGADGSGYISDAIPCIDFALSHGAQILSNSWGGGGFSQLFLEAIRRAEKAGVLFVAAAGNYGLNIDPGGFFPASYNQYASNVIAVAATDGYDVLASFSDYGPKSCEIAAPGVGIFSTVPTGSCPLCDPSGYAYLSGTSMATPHVAGAAALVKAQFPGASLTQLRSRLLYSGDHPSEMEGYTRRGRLNVFNALQSDTIPPGSPANLSVAQASGTGLRLTWTASGENGPSDTVSAYQVFYNTIPDITTATMIEPKMTPGPPGTLETADLPGLVPNTVYYVSIRAVDKVGNTSELVTAPPAMTRSTGFFDGAESALSFATTYGPAWTSTTGDAHTGQHSYVSPSDLAQYRTSTLEMTQAYTVSGPSYLTLWGKMDLDSSSDSLACFVQDNTSGKSDYFYLGAGYSAWTQYRLSLGAYVGHAIQVGVYVYRGGNETSPSSHRVWIDDVAIVQLTKVWTDDVEGATQFTGFSPWGVTTERSSSPSRSWSDSPEANYANNVSLPLIQNASITPPSDVGSLNLVFKTKFDLEPNRDFLEAYASPDDGANWEYLGALTGTSNWTTVLYNLPGWKKVRAMFYLVTNEAITRDGVYLDDIGVWGESFEAGQGIPPTPARTAVVMPVSAGGASTAVTGEGSGVTQAGYATAEVSSGGTPHGTAVLSLTQRNTVVSEAAVASSPPTTSARIFIDHRTTSGTGAVDIDTGLALVNRGPAEAHITYDLRDPAGTRLASGQGTLATGAHIARFIRQLNEVAPGFVFPSDFGVATRFGSLDIGSDQPISVTALRLTVNQRGDLLLTSTPVVNQLISPGNSEIYFPQFVDGAGYATTLSLLNTSNAPETGTITISGDDGSALPVSADNGTRSSVFTYSIPSGGVYVLQTAGASADVVAGSVKVSPSSSTTTPAGAVILSYSSGGIRITESGVPAAIPTTHARIFIDQSLGHDTGLAIASPNASATPVTFQAFQADGSTIAGSAAAPVKLNGNGHFARYVGQLISGLPAGFTGVLDISAPSPFVAVTLRSLKNERGEVLLTTFPIADFSHPAPAPIVFPQVVSGGGYTTQFILLSCGAASGATLKFFDEKGVPLPIAK
jgi:subtilisin family serine protease